MELSFVAKETFCEIKMNFANISELTIGVLLYQEDYNEVVYCYKNVIKLNLWKRCTNITGMLPYEYFIMFMFQVRFIFNK
jgi:hypothetical protein